MGKESIYSKVRNFYKDNNIKLQGKTIVVGVSGGADSLCLLYILNALSKEYGYKVLAAHVNHGIRETAIRDEKYVQKVCGELGVSLEILRINCIELSKKMGVSVEEAGRIERYKFFNKLSEDGYIAVAHHRNDQAETIIFNMVRGTGITGLMGIKPVNDNIIRPLLDVSRNEIIEFLENENIPYMTDETNEDTHYSRNKIRLSVIPSLLEVNEAAVEHITELADNLCEIEDLLSLQTNILWEKYVSIKNGDIYIAKNLKEEHPALIKEIIHKALIELAGKQKDISATHVLAVYGLMDLTVGSRLDLIYGIKAYKDYDCIRLSTKETADSQSNDWDLSLVTIEEKLTSGLGAFPKEAYTKWLDYDKIKGSVSVRTRQPGDYLIINDKGGRKLLKDYFIDEKIPKAQRDCIPLVTVGSKVLWVVGKRISEDVKLDENTVRILELKYRK